MSLKFTILQILFKVNIFMKLLSLPDKPVCHSVIWWGFSILPNIYFSWSFNWLPFFPLYAYQVMPHARWTHLHAMCDVVVYKLLYYSILSKHMKQRHTSRPSTATNLQSGKKVNTDNSKLAHLLHQNPHTLTCKKIKICKLMCL